MRMKMMHPKLPSVLCLAIAWVCSKLIGQPHCGQEMALRLTGLEQSGQFDNEGFVWETLGISFGITIVFSHFGQLMLCPAPSSETISG